MHHSFILVEISVLKICKFPLVEALLPANHYYLSERSDFNCSLGWGPSGLEVHGKVRVSKKELERVEGFIVASKYSIADNNCEHFAKYVKHGLPMSAQVDSWWMRLGAEAIALLQPAQEKKCNVSDYVSKQVADIFEGNLRQARIDRANRERRDFWMQRGIDLS